MNKVRTGETIGIKRKFDKLGRIVIPKEFRDEMKIEDNSEGEIFLVPNGIFIKIK